MEKNIPLYNYCLRLGDSALILGHRLSEWCAHGPFLEEDIALTNTSLDLVGRSRPLLTYAGEIKGDGETEDDLAFKRDVMDFKNPLITELPNGDFGVTIVRQMLYDIYSYLLYSELLESKDERLQSLAQKTIKEDKYHLRHSSEWVVRLGDGTEESHKRSQKALDDLWMYTQDMFDMTEEEKQLAKDGIAADLNKIKPRWEDMVDQVIERAKLKKPDQEWMQSGSQQGRHT
ncbi:MAG: 1,2-phenylacetyl-CoA epoxidase subunit PaaC, partial [Flavobacteriales bacterium]